MKTLQKLYLLSPFNEYVDCMVGFVAFQAANWDIFCHAQKCRLSCNDTGNSSFIFP